MREEARLLAGHARRPREDHAEPGAVGQLRGQALGDRRRVPVPLLADPVMVVVLPPARRVLAVAVVLAPAARRVHEARQLRHVVRRHPEEPRVAPVEEGHEDRREVRRRHRRLGRTGLGVEHRPRARDPRQRHHHEEVARLAGEERHPRRVGQLPGIGEEGGDPPEVVLHRLARGVVLRQVCDGPELPAGREPVAVARSVGQLEPDVARHHGGSRRLDRRQVRESLQGRREGLGQDGWVRQGGGGHRILLDSGPRRQYAGGAGKPG